MWTKPIEMVETKWNEGLPPKGELSKALKTIGCRDYSLHLRSTRVLGSDTAPPLTSRTLRRKCLSR